MVWQGDSWKTTKEPPVDKLTRAEAQSRLDHLRMDGNLNRMEWWYKTNLLSEAEFRDYESLFSV